MIEHDRRIIHSSEESNWRTPPACYQKLRESFNFAIDLAADTESALTERYFGPEGVAEDALAVDWAQWAPYGAMFLNPPYSKKQKMPIEPWVEKCWKESQKGCRIVSILPFSAQTEWYRRYVYGHHDVAPGALGCNWSGHAAMEEWRLAHRISFLRPDGTPASNAGVNSVVVIWRPNPRFVGVWQPAVRYWSYR